MKRLFYLMLVVLGTVAFVSCSDDDENNGGGEIDEPIEEPVYHYGEITMTTNSYYGDNMLSLTISTFNNGDTLSIDYGDGYIQENAIAEYGSLEIKYGYSDNEDYVVTIKGNIRGIHCYHSNGTRYISSLDVSGCTALENLSCWHNELTSLDVSKNTALTHLYCYNNSLTSLDVSKNTALTYLYCSDNELTSLDVSGCTALIELGCGNNQLTSLNVSKNTALEYLSCHNNQLTTLDVSGCTALTYLSCYDNQFTAAEMNKIYEALPTVEDGTLSCDQLGNPGIAEQKGWEVSFE